MQGMWRYERSSIRMQNSRWILLIILLLLTIPHRLIWPLPPTLEEGELYIKVVMREVTWEHVKHVSGVNAFAAASELIFILWVLLLPCSVWMQRCRVVRCWNSTRGWSRRSVVPVTVLPWYCHGAATAMLRWDTDITLYYYSASHCCWSTAAG